MSGANPDTGPVVELYDTTLRDGAQAPGLSYSVEDRLRILHKLDDLGVPYIEGGWPGANPRDTEFFQIASKEALKNATLTAFGMTRRAGEKAEDSAVLHDMLEAGTEVVCLVGKSWDLHVTEALRTDLDEGVAMVGDSIAFLVKEGRRVFFDAEHFFDGYKSDREFTMRVLRAAEEAGAERLVLCDTNGGTLPSELGVIVAEVGAETETRLGIHAHNDTGCAVANSLTAFESGVFQVQGVVNGYGERTGNANLVTIAADLSLKMGVDCLPEGAIQKLTEVSHFVAEVANFIPDPRQPFTGRYAFTHKAGLHTSGVARISRAYEHIPPEVVGNNRNVAVSELGGGSTLQMKADGFALELDKAAIPAMITTVKDKEAQGYAYETADASLELLMRRAMGWEQEFFDIESYRVTVDSWEGTETVAEATVRVQAQEKRHIETAQGEGPVGALDTAFRKALGSAYPELDHIELRDFRVRVLDTKVGTGAVVRVLIDSSNGEREWTTIGVSENIIDASWEALTDSILFGLLHPRSDA
ncbi:MAG: citramalate synthase [Actinobacteria bacterium]|nr:citramalate synthase [Actinomycetota bacterium]